MKLTLLPSLLLAFSCSSEHSELRKLNGFNEQLRNYNNVTEEDPNMKQNKLYEKIRKQTEDPDLPKNIELKLSQEMLDMKRRQTSSGCSDVEHCTYE